MGYFKDLLKGLKQGVIRNADEELIRIELDRRMRNGNRNGDGRASLNIIPEYTPHRSVSLKEWRYAVDLAKSPHNRMRAPLYSVYDRVTIDLELSRLMQKQMEHLQKARFRLVKPNGEEDTEAIKLFETLWWWDYVQYVLEADAYGHSLMELFEMKDKPTAFTVNNRRVMVRELNCVTLVKREHVKPEFGLWVVEETDTEGYSYRSPEMLPYYIEAGGAEDLGYLMKVSPIEIAKRYALGTWSEFNEKIAFPFRWATMPSGNKTRQSAMAKILANMGSAGWGIFHQNEEVKLLEMSKTDPHKCFLELIAYADRKMESFIEGEGLKNEMGEGSFAADKVRSDMKIERYRTNKTYLEYFSNDQLMPRLVQMGYPLAGYRLESDDKRDVPVEEQIKIDAQLLQHFKISPAFISKRYGIPEEEISERMKGETPALQVENLADFLIEKKKPVAGSVAVSVVENHGLLFRSRSEYYADDCCSHGHEPRMADCVWPDFDGWMENLARKVFDKKLKAGGIDLDTFERIEAILYEQVQLGYGNRLASLEFGKPDHLLLANLLENTSVFAAFKNHENVNLMAGLLVDDDGKPRTFNQFKELALELNTEYNEVWLQSEYQTARASARMAVNWQKAVEDKDVAPNLRYDTANDDRVRESHRQLDGIVRPLDDEFWDMWYPPNGFRCRCDAVSETADTPLVDAPADMPDMMDGFGHNSGKSGMVFNEEHPYIKSASAKSKGQVQSFLDAYLVKNFAKAGTLKEAEQFAVNSGIASKANYKGLELEKANATNKQLMRLKLATGQSFHSIQSERMDVNAFMSSEKDGDALLGRINLNINNTRTLLQDNQALKLLNERKYTTIKDYDGLVSHEVGHLLTKNNTLRIPDDVLKNTVLNISKNAMKNLNETLAEIYTLYIYGGREALSPQAINLFNQYSKYQI